MKAVILAMQIALSHGGLPLDGLTGPPQTIFVRFNGHRMHAIAGCNAQAECDKISSFIRGPYYKMFKHYYYVCTFVTDPSLEINIGPQKIVNFVGR